jgi:predicted esterase
MARRAPLLILLALAALGIAPRAAAQTQPEVAPPELAPPELAPPAGWCLPELVTLEGDVCWAAAPAAAAAPAPPNATGGAAAPRASPRTLVIFLHGLLDDGAQWQLPLQRGMLAMAKHHGFALLAPRGLNGVGPGRLPQQIAWPAREDVRGQEEALLAKIMRARREAETREGAPYDHVFVFGFSNGAYYASSLALRGRLQDVDGYAVFAGGSAKSPPAAAGAARKPLFVGVASADRTTVQRSRELVKALKRSGWPHRAMEAKVGHTVADAHVRAALAWLHARAAGEPDPPVRTRAEPPPRRTAKRGKR